MTASPARAVLGVLLLAAAVAGIDLVRDKTLTRHEPERRGTALLVEVTATARDGAEEDEAGLAEALASLCRLEVPASLAPGSFESLGDHRYRFLLVPDLDTADARQFHGCIQDLRIDHFLARVSSMESVPAPAR